MSKTLDHAAKYFELSEDQLTIRAMRPPGFVIGIYGFVTAVLLLGPLIAIIATIATTGRAPSINIFGLSFAIIISYFPLRTLLWNLFGKETYTFREDKIELISDFKYFKNEKESAFSLYQLTFSSEFAGYEEDNNRVLIIESRHGILKCSAKIPGDEMDELIRLLTNRYAYQ